MSIGMVLLTVAAIFVFFGVAQRVLDRMYLSDRAALVVISLMFFGTLLPNLTFGSVQVSIGGGLIPVGICIYLLVRAGTNKERLRALLGSVLTAGIVYAVSAFVLPDEPEQLPFDPMYLNGIIAGLIAYAFGRSRRGAFICGVLGVLLADLKAELAHMQNEADTAFLTPGGKMVASLRLAQIRESVDDGDYLKLLENVKEGKVFKSEEAVKWHCGNCGHVYEGEEAPQVCPVCAHPQSYFRIKAENY